MIFFKPMPVKTVEQAPVKMKVINVPVAPRLVLSPSGTLVPVEDMLDWDFDKLNGAGE
jgi:hypothetical protein